ncbi:hypothetical protein HK104_005655 [Borealophlyctis nickersoniae]|nr:hypothetical protein HK104_005655 [Borealophlyctis nickersoniae]
MSTQVCPDPLPKGRVHDVRCAPYKGYSKPLLFLNWLGRTSLNRAGFVIFPIPRDKLLAKLSTLLESPFLGDSSPAKRGWVILITILADKNLGLSTAGRLWHRNLHVFMDERNTLVRYLDDNPEIPSIDIGKPIIVTGVHRTGSTLLQRLLARDPACRSTTAIDSFAGPGVKLLPPVTSRKDHFESPRAKAWERSVKEWERNAPEHRWTTQKYHRFIPAEFEEDILFLGMHGVMSALSLLFGELSPYTQWLMHEKEQAPSFLLLKRYIQALHHSWAPKSHWVLKAPHYALHVSSLSDTFPDARVVICNRDPVDTVLSNCRYWMSDLRHLVDSLDLHAVGRSVLHQCLVKVERLTRFRTHLRRTDPHRERDMFFDVDFDELTTSPIDVVRKLYAHYGMTVSEEFVSAMEAYLNEDEVLRKRENVNGGGPEWLVLEDPRPLADFGLTPEFIREAWAAAEKRGRGGSGTV